MEGHELAGWTLLGFSWVGMEAIVVRVLAWSGATSLPSDILAPSWSWQSIVLHVLTLSASVALTHYVLEGVEADAKKGVT